MVDFYGKLVGKYSVRPMDAMGKILYYNSKRQRVTPSKTNMEPEKAFSEEDNHFQTTYFQVPHEFFNSFSGVYSHRIHGAGIFTYIWLKFMVNFGKYNIHGSYGIEPVAKYCIKWNSQK